LVPKSVSSAAWLVVSTLADEATPALFTRSVTSPATLIAAATSSGRAQGDEELVQLLERLAHPLPGGDGTVESFLRGMELV
jgi:hypothetical protein